MPHLTRHRTASGHLQAPLPREARWALGGLALTMLLSSLGTSIANVGLPTIARAFGAPFQDVQWIVLAYLVAVTSLVVGAGRLGDLVGRRRLLAVGLVVFTAASALCALAPSLPLLVAARGVQGIGAAAMMALTVAFVGDAVPKARTGSAMGLLGTMSAVGTALGPSLGGALISALGWRSIFVVNIPLGALALLLVLRHLPAGRAGGAARGERFDSAGTAVLGLTLAAYTLALTLGRGHFGPLNAALLASACAGAAAFVLVERRAAAPLVRLALLRDCVLSSSLAMSGLVSTVMMTTLVVGPFYLSRSLGLSPARVGLLLSAGPLATALAALPAGRLADRLGTVRLTVAGLAAITAGVAVLALLPRSAGAAGYVAVIVVATVGYGLFQTANNAAVMAGAGVEGRGVVSGLLNLSRNLGLVTGASVLGAVFTFGTATADITSARPTAVASGMHAAYAAAALLAAVALVLALRRGRRPGLWAAGDASRVESRSPPTHGPRCRGDTTRQQPCDLDTRPPVSAAE